MTNIKLFLKIYMVVSEKTFIYFSIYLSDKVTKQKNTYFTTFPYLVKS